MFSFDRSQSSDRSTQSPAPAPRSRRRRIDPGEKTRGQTLGLPDDIFDRLQLHRGQSPINRVGERSDILDRKLPKLRIESDD